jgi:ubiquinone biosynthesis protein Coq4
LIFNTLLSEAEFDPHLLQDMFRLQEALEDTSLGKSALDNLLEHPSLRALVDEGWRPEKIELEKLNIMPAGSLGKVLASNLIHDGFDPALILNMDPFPVDSGREFVIHRNWQTHDIFHTLTGFDINNCGELGLQAFYYAQTRQPLHLCIMFKFLFFTTSHDMDFKEALLGIARGFQLGLNAPLLYSYKFEDAWDRTLTDWRKELCLPITDDCSRLSVRSSSYPELSLQ